MYLGIDLGTSEVKVVLLDDKHNIVATASSGLTVQRPHAVWSEQNPADWWNATDITITKLSKEFPQALRAVQGIGLSGQMHGAVVLNKANEVLRPAILWNDARSELECAELEARWPELRAITGNIAFPGFTAPKLVWLKKFEPELFAKIAKVLLPKDWLRFKLSGEFVGDMSDSAGTLWLDVEKRVWSQDALAATDLTLNHMPTLVEGSEISARLTPELASRWGMNAGILIAGGAGDNAASAVGIGAVRPNEGFISLGTSGVVFLSNARYSPNPASAVHAFCHAIPNTWHQMSVMLSAANGLSWVTKLLGQPDVATLMAQVEKLTSEQKARAPMFLPYLNGERTPHNDAQARGVFFGLDNEHDAAALGYSVIEGVSFGLLDGWRALDSKPGDVKSLSLVGGGARSPLWAQLLASAIGVPMVSRKGGEVGGALGAARLAWLANGGSIDEVCLAPEIAAVTEPDAAQAAMLQPRYQRFGRLYQAVKEEFRN
jgi:xylulokinase